MKGTLPFNEAMKDSVLFIPLHSEPGRLSWGVGTA